MKDHSSIKEMDDVLRKHRFRPQPNDVGQPHTWIHKRHGVAHLGWMRDVNVFLSKFEIRFLDAGRLDRYLRKHSVRCGCRRCAAFRKIGG